jgi:hypothetical protein
MSEKHLRFSWWWVWRWPPSERKQILQQIRLTLLRYCEYVDETPLVSTPMIFPLVSSLVVNCSNGTLFCFSFSGIRRATHMRHGIASTDSEVTSPPSALSLGYGNNVDEIWKPQSLSSFSSQHKENKIKMYLHTNPWRSVEHTDVGFYFQ